MQVVLNYAIGHGWPCDIKDSPPGSHPPYDVQRGSTSPTVPRLRTIPSSKRAVGFINRPEAETSGPMVSITLLGEDSIGRYNQLGAVYIGPGDMLIGEPTATFYELHQSGVVTRIIYNTFRAQYGGLERVEDHQLEELADDFRYLSPEFR